MFIHDLIKIKYIDEGYLSNIPHRLVTDEEMFDAFLSEEGYFQANYPLICSDYEEDYDRLVTVIKYHVDQYLDAGANIPSWIYSYMLGEVISINSDEADISYLYELSNLETESSTTVFGEDIAHECYKVSSQWIKKTNPNNDYRPPTMFGEPHVIKSLRIDATDINT